MNYERRRLLREKSSSQVGIHRNSANVQFHWRYKWKKQKNKTKQKPVKRIDLHNKLLLSLAGTHISYTHGKFSSCIQGTFLFSTLHSNQVDFSSMAACSDESWIWWKCYGPGIHCKDQQCFAVSTSVKCFHPLTSKLITLSCSPWT